MNVADFLQIFFYFAILIALVPLLGNYMSKVFNGQQHLLTLLLGWLERGVFRALGTGPGIESNWKTYTCQLLLINMIGLVLLFFMLLIQKWLPLNPSHLPNVSWHTAFNTAVSFMTNTNWQYYAGEITMSLLVQMTGLAVQNFVSAATGIAVLLALIRGLTRKNSSLVGNYWVDVTRAILYDYITKPFRTGELLARIRAAIRGSKDKDVESILSFGALSLNLMNHTVQKNGEFLKLTSSEYELLSLLAKNEGRVLTHQYILKEIWGFGYWEQTQYLRVFIAQLRKKIEDDPSKSRLLTTESGIGYRFGLITS
jgi:hypothetical protein